MRLELIVELILVQILLMLLLLPKHIIVLLLMMLLQVMVLKNGAHRCYVLVSTFSSTSSKYFFCDFSREGLTRYWLWCESNISTLRRKWKPEENYVSLRNEKAPNTKAFAAAFVRPTATCLVNLGESWEEREKERGHVIQVVRNVIFIMHLLRRSM